MQRNAKSHIWKALFCFSLNYITFKQVKMLYILLQCDFNFSLLDQHVEFVDNIWFRTVVVCSQLNLKDENEQQT